MSQKFQVNQRVCSKKTGFPCVGTIKYCADPTYFMLNRHPEFGTNWSNLYPDWKQKTVYVLKLDKPQPAATFEEYLNGQEETEIAREKYCIDVPPQWYIAYPEDDLENMED